jgi:predicted NAD/FAD-binding protein
VRAVLRDPLDAVRAERGGVAVVTDHGRERFDHVVLACHSDQALALLADPSDDERAVLGAVPYQPNRAYLHTDTALMPKRRRAWASWNYLSTGRPARADDGHGPSVAVTYWLNRLQPLPFDAPVLVTLNPPSPPDPARTLGVYDYAHPVFDTGAILAQRRLPELQGLRNTWFAGAWTGWGFHEDGLKSGLAVAAALTARPLPAGERERLAA